MKNKNAIARYRLIDNLMTNKQKKPPTLSEIVDYVSEKLGTSVSVPTIQNDIYDMRYDEGLGFFAPLVYDKARRGYKYEDEQYSINKLNVSDEELQGLEMAISILEQFSNVPAIKLFDDAIQKIALSVKYSREKALQSDILLLDRPKRYLGIEYLNDIVEAIRNKNVIRLSYLPFNKEQAKKHTLHPYFIKEYNGRMYLIAKDIDPIKSAKFLTFAFDRIQDVVVLSATFIEENLNANTYFHSTIGISMHGDAPQHVELQVLPNQLNYLISQPIHHSQKILKQNKNGAVISMEVVINYELISLILSMGKNVKVLKPKSLAFDIKKQLGEMLEMYKG